MQFIAIKEDAWNSLQQILTDIRASVEAKQGQSSSNAWLTIEEAMARLKVSKRTLQTYRDKGKLGFSQIKGKIYFKESDINEFLERHYHKPFSTK